jgi:zinc protease
VTKILSSLFLLSILFPFSLLNAQGEKILPYPINQTKLNNGLNVVSVQFDSPGLAAFYIVVRVGSRNEIEEGVTGFAHFFEHMMFRGTDKFPREKYNEVLMLTGAGANANTSLDRTIYHMTGNAEMLETMFEIEADRFMNLKYSEHDFKAEAGAVKGEYTKNFANPFSRLYEATLNTAFDEHTYKHTTMGFFEDIVEMPNQYSYSLEFFDRYYKPEYSTVIVVGDVTHNKVVELSEKYFGEWQPGAYNSIVPEEPVQKETRAVHLQDASVPPVLSLNYKGPAFNDSGVDSPALDVLNTILFSQNSDLYKKLVLQERKVRNLYGGAYDTRDPYLITIQAVLVDKDDMQYVKDEIINAVDKIKNEGVDQQTLDNTKSNIKYQFAMSIDNVDAIANSIAHYVSLTGDPESLNRTYSYLEKVSVDDIQRVANKFFIDNTLTIATISPDTEGGVK